MGTRADFYVGRGANAEWIGSIAYDGYVDGPVSGILSVASSEDVWRQLVHDGVSKRSDGTLPEQGWPWPWENSHTTDWSYTFDDGRVWASMWGREWFDALGCVPSDDDDYFNSPKVDFPNMASQQSVTFGRRSGVLVLGK
jgi:hypothetical protein